MKNLLKFITCGSVDDGKSTLIGHILYDTKKLYTDQEQALELDSKVGSRGGEIDYSLLLDGLMAEREQGITIDVAYRYFTTDNRSFIVADTPGHEEYTRNMAVGASFADLAIILVDASQGVLVQTRRHARICALMGIRYFVFALNKMDLVDYSEEKFRKIEADIQALAQELKLYSVKIIPVSATAGDNLTQHSDAMPWYTGTTLLNYLENVDIDEASHEEGFYMPVQRVCRPNHTFRGFQGQIEAGEISVGDEIHVQPSEETAHVKSILVGDKDAQTARAGQPVTIQLDREIDVSRGRVLTKDSHITCAKAFQATLLWMDDEPLTEGKEYFVKVGTRTIAGEIRSIRYKTDVNTGEQVQAHSLKKNEIAYCDITVAEEIPVDTFEKHKTLGEVLFIDRVTNMTSACGVVEALVQDSSADRTVQFQSEDGTVKTHLFETVYMQLDSGLVGRYDPQGVQFKIGDKLPLTGEGYAYPDSFDIIARESKQVVRIINGIYAEVVPLAQYQVDGVPLVDARGNAIAVSTQDGLQEYLTTVAQDEAKLNELLHFETFRKIVFRSGEQEDYVI
ncbi:sulfate adenylyltransferase subunit 1 [Butyricicoccus intestinisimiae]|uniref:Sulfate adenylyltransferase n=1 Tax=Butyricicoccus intestinisimiae TaxID=2841509 RepID=A0ABS6EUG4_9FIRM|nr:GTP-binding protein [Butyricicoccus intestinisimiae]MBU5490796.1 sulfate adenylyltransferase [Butyricicoccus intestinisimiae]